jgi:hypothetical protein
MRLFIRSIGLLSVVAALSFAAVGTAAAATATVSPGGSTRGTGTTSWQLLISGSSSSATFNCTGATFSATLASSSGAFPLAITSNYQQQFSGCRIAGGISYNDTCTASASLGATAVTTSGVTPFSLTGLNCTATLSGSPSCTARITGSLTQSYSNTTGQLSVPVTGQSITVSGSTCTSTIPNGTATFSNTSGGTFVYTVSPATTISVV